MGRREWRISEVQSTNGESDFMIHLPLNLDRNADKVVDHVGEVQMSTSFGMLPIFFDPIIG